MCSFLRHVRETNHAFLPLPPVNLARGCGVSSRCLLVNQRLSSKHRLRISTLNSTSRLPAHSAVLQPASVCVFPFCWTPFPANQNGNNDHNTTPCAILQLGLKGWQAHSPLTKAMIRLLCCWSSSFTSPRTEESSY